MERPIRPAAELMRAARDLVLGSDGVIAFEDIYTRLRSQEGLADAPADERRGALREAIAEAYWELMGAGLVLPMDLLGWDPVSQNGREIHIAGRIRKSSLALELQGAGTIALRNPDMFMQQVTPISDRVGRCIREAVEAYIRGLPLATVVMIGAAVESAWDEVGRQLAPYSPGVARVMANEMHSPYQVQEAIERSGRRFGATQWHRTLLSAFVRLRNYAIHRELGEPVDLTMAATMLYQVPDYMRDLNGLALAYTREVREHPHTSDTATAVVTKAVPG